MNWTHLKVIFPRHLNIDILCASQPHFMSIWHGLFWLLWFSNFSAFGFRYDFWSFRIRNIFIFDVWCAPSASFCRFNSQCRPEMKKNNKESFYGLKYVNIWSDWVLISIRYSLRFDSVKNNFDAFRSIRSFSIHTFDEFLPVNKRHRINNVQ